MKRIKHIKNEVTTIIYLISKFIYHSYQIHLVSFGIPKTLLLLLLLFEFYNFKISSSWLFALFLRMLNIHSFFITNYLS